MDTRRLVEPLVHWINAGPRWRLWAVVGGGGVLVAAVVLAAAGGGAADSTSLGGGVIVDILLKLGLVVGLIYASLFALRRWPGGLPGLFAAAPKQVAVLETTRLAPRQALHLVRAGSQVFLVGATDQTLTLLAEVELPAAPAPAPAAEFPAALHRALNTAETPVPAGEAA